MTLPQGGKAITNRFAGRCQTCRQQVEVDQGAALRDDINHTKWATFHLTCLPAPYEQADVKPHADHPYVARHRPEVNATLRAAQAATVHSINTTGPIMPPPTTPPILVTGARLIVFSGPIHASDGLTHDVSADNVLVLHGLVNWLPACHVLYFGPANKQDYKPEDGDFVIGPRMNSNEYTKSREALAAWLVQKGITR